MRIKRCLYLINLDLTPAEIVKEMELAESEARDIAIKMISLLNELQIESRFQEKIRC
jgi:hypothetical protein